MKKLFIHNNFGTFIICLIAILLTIFAFKLSKNQQPTSKQTIISTSGDTKSDKPDTNNNWKDYIFKDVGITFSAPSDLAVSGEISNPDSFILIAQRGKYPDADYYQLYGVYNLSSDNISSDDLKKDLDVTSIQENNIGGYRAITGQFKGERNRFVTYIITNRGLLTLSTSQPTDVNKALTEAILKTFKFDK
jgi:hypothetical protein